MLVHQISSTRTLSRVSFRPSYQPAILKNYPSKGHGWTIEYAVYDPQTGRMARFSQKINTIRRRFCNFYDFRNYAMNIVNDINHRLSLGWSPLEYVPTTSADRLITESYCSINTNSVAPTVPVLGHTITNDIVTETQTSPDVESVVLECKEEYLSRQEQVVNNPTVKLVDVLDKFLLAKGQELREDSMRSYKSVSVAIKKFLTHKGLDEIPITNFNKRTALDFMEYLTSTKQMRNNTYNNYLKVSRTIFQWSVEQCYIENNPFSHLKKKREEDKIRSLIDTDSRRMVMDYLKEQNDIGYLLVCHLVYTSLIRPLEISHIKIGDIDFERKCIHLDGKHTKTHNTRESAISDTIIDLMRDMKIDKYPKDYYLIGKGFVPSKEIAPRASFNKRWAKVRTALNLPMEMQLYSLKDSGITEMLEAHIPAITVMKHADHHDLRMTEKYANHKDKKLIEKIRMSAPEF